jgi:uncharacterized membrane protein
VTKYEWVLALHVTAAFLLVGGGVFAGALYGLARRRELPSEVALLLGLVQIAVVVIGIGSIGSLVFGLWLVDVAGYGYGDGWVIAAVLFWLLAGGLGGAGGNRDKRTRLLAARLAAEGDRPSDELRALLRDPVALALNAASTAALVVLLALMVWKPGA